MEDDCSYYLKYPPNVSSYILTEDRFEKVELHIKEVHNDCQIKLKIDQNIYSMYDDGTMGDNIAGDNIYTNNQVLLPFVETKTYVYHIFEFYTNFIKNGDLVHTDRNRIYYLCVNNDFLASLTIPDISYLGCSDEILLSDNFIYTVKGENWKELNQQSICEAETDYVISPELLFDYWKENEILNIEDDLMYCQIDFAEPSGQYASVDGNSMFLGVPSIYGVLPHEMLHRWVPLINKYLGLELGKYSGFTDLMHHPHIFRNTSGFLCGYSRWNGIYFTDQLNSIVKENDSTLYFCRDHNFRPSGFDWDTQAQYNDYEMYLMGLIPIDSVDFPIYFLKNVYKREVLGDTILGHVRRGEKLYFEELVGIDKERLYTIKNQMLADYPGRTNFDGKIIRMLPVFTGSHKLSLDEIKMVNVLIKEISAKSHTDRKVDENNFNGSIGSNNTYYEATMGKGHIELFVPKLQANFIEEVQICEGESYLGWTNAGEHTRSLPSISGNDSIITTILNITMVVKPTISQKGDTLISSVEKGNQWYYEQVPIIGATDQTYTINKSGSYTVQVTSDNGCVSEISEVVNVWLTLVNNIKYRLQIYPNPTTGLLQIEGLPQNWKAVVSIYNATGQKIEQKEIVKSNATIDLSRLKKGIYYLSFNSGFNSAIKILKE